MKNMNYIRGCLIGGAVGDALGYAVEFLTEKDIFEKYGKSGICEYDLSDGSALISDDTQMSLFTANGLILGKLCGAKNNCERAEHIHNCLLDWLRTQSPYNDEAVHAEHSWLCDIPELCVPRAPGSTCISALMSGNQGSIKAPINFSKGCGGVMRTAPIGLYYNSILSQDEIDMLAAQAAADTHGHELGYIPAAVLVHMVSKLVTYECNSVSEALDSALEAVKRLFADSEELSVLTNLLEKAKKLSKSGLSDVQAIHELGKGFVAEETIAIAVYCGLKYEDDFEKAIIAAVNHNGDSDSTGAVCGNIVGALAGLDGIPRKFLGELELKEIILELADDLFYSNLLEKDEFLGSPRQYNKYVNHKYEKQ